MADARFNIVFSGELVAGADPQRVRENLAKVFKMDLARVEGLFSGKAVVIKKDADQATAMKFRAVLRQAGAQCEMVPLGEAEEVQAAPPATAQAPASAQAEAATAQAAPPPAEQAPAAAAQSGQPADMETVGTIRTGGTGFSSEFDVAPVGADIAEHQEGPPPIEPDISHLTMAPPGTELEELKADKKPVNPDISHLSLASPEGGQS